MGKRNPAFDAYIADARPFARPILTKVRALLHKALPDVEEVLKWGCPTFLYKGILGGMAAFKNHALFHFWHRRSLPDPRGIFKGTGPFATGKITDVSQLPADAILIQYVREAAKLNEAGPPPRRKGKPKPPVKTPRYFLAALKKKPKALEKYDAFPPSHKREYVEWIEEAKREETRDARVKTAVTWIAQGKSRNWKYSR